VIVQLNERVDSERQQQISLNETVSTLKTEKIELKDKNRKLQDDLVKGNQIIQKKVEELKRLQGKCKDRKRELKEQYKIVDERESRIRRLESQLSEASNTSIQRDREILSLKTELLKTQEQSKELEERLSTTNLALEHVTNQMSNNRNPLSGKTIDPTYVAGSYSLHGLKGSSYSTYVPPSRLLESFAKEDDKLKTTPPGQLYSSSLAATSTKQVVYNPKTNSPDKFK
jgi:myosin heavy subunit